MAPSVRLEMKTREINQLEERVLKVYKHLKGLFGSTILKQIPLKRVCVCVCVWCVWVISLDVNDSVSNLNFELFTLRDKLTGSSVILTPCCNYNPHP